MPFDASVVRVMIASPSDVDKSRAAVELAIHDWNREHSESQKIVFIPWHWKEGANPSLEAPAQTIINAQGVDRSDLIVAVFGSRLGSPVESGASGTVQEIERARGQGKPVHVFFSGEPQSNVDPDQLRALLDFKKQIEAIGLHGSFDSSDELRRKVEYALSYYENHAAQQSNNYFTRGLSDRVYDEVFVDWSYRPGSSESVWDAKTEQMRRMTIRDRRGIGSFLIRFDRDSDTTAPAFGTFAVPEFELDPASDRSSPGSMILRPAHRMSGTSYAQNVEFAPQLGEGDSATVIFRGQLPGYRYAYSDEIIAGSAGTTLGLRDWDYSAYDITHPVALLTYSVFLSDSTGATPLGPRVDHTGTPDNELTTAILRDGYTQERAERDGEPGWEMKMTVREPVFGCEYILMWRPPSKPKQ
jgi:hypothetical protein